MDLNCPDPQRCPVVEVKSLPQTETVHIAPAPWWRCYDGTWGYDEFNPGHGDTRFSPFPDATRRPVPTTYVGATARVAVLETTFHSVDHNADRLVYESELRAMQVCRAAMPTGATAVDLRDGALARMGLARNRIVSTAAEHYPCTRRIARELHTRHHEAQGIIWFSRQAELVGEGQIEVLLLFGDRYPSNRGSWPRLGLGSVSLLSHEGRLLVDRLATELDATVIPDG